MQDFFDLIVGTRSFPYRPRHILSCTDQFHSTGGLIGLGLASKAWTVEECIYHFTELCQKAFTPRVGINIPGMSLVIESLHHSRYETVPLEQALQQAFSKDDFLFGGPRSMNHRTKVAVTATNSGTVSVLANYNRNCVDKRKILSYWKTSTLTHLSSIPLPETGKVIIRTENLGSVRLRNSFAPQSPTNRF